MVAKGEQKKDPGLGQREEGQVSPCSLSSSRGPGPPADQGCVWPRTRQECPWGLYGVHAPGGRPDISGLFRITFIFFLKSHEEFRSGWKLVCMFIFLIVSVEKRVGDSDSSLRLWAGARVCLHSVLCSSRDLCQPGEKLHITSHVRSELPTRVPRGGERTKISFKEANGRGGNKKGKGPPGMRREKGQGL